MKAGDKVICRHARGYWFTEGKEYTLLDYQPPYREEGDGFTWPAYVYVVDDEGKRAYCHANRFVPVNEA